LLKNKLAKIKDILKIKKVYYDYNKKIKSIISSNNIIFNLDFEQIEKARKFWNKFDVKLNLEWHKAYSMINNNFDPKYIPEDLFYALIIPTLGNLNLSKAYSDKNNYDSFFPLIKKPRTMIRNMNGIYYDNNYNYLKSEEVNSIFSNLEGKYVIKPTLDTSQGIGVHIIKFKFDKIYLNDEIISIKELENIYKKDFLIQEKINQNQLINDIYPYSLNSFRIISIKYQNKVYILSSVLRLGNHGLKIDNFTQGGVAVGVNRNGYLNNYAVDKNFLKYYKHPYTDVEFKDVKIPNFQKAEEMVEKLHKQLYYFDLASWDLALNSKGEYVFIEVNLGGQDINMHQANNGPLFGEKTETIMQYILNKN